MQRAVAALYKHDGLNRGEGGKKIHQRTTLLYKMGIMWPQVSHKGKQVENDNSFVSVRQKGLWQLPALHVFF